VAEDAISEVSLVGAVPRGRALPGPARPRAAEGTWLCADDAERQRMLDMDVRLAPVRVRALGVLALASLGMSPWLGLWTLVPIVFAALGFAVARRLSDRTDRPEYVLFGSWAFSELVIAATVVLAGLDSGLLAWLAIPVVTLSARFSTHGVFAGVAFALALCLAVAFGTDAASVLEYPGPVIGPAALVIAVGILSTALMRSDFEHRGEAVIDQLTGMLNRNALMRRAFELEQQSQLTGEPVGIVIGDLDNFKRVNDTFGHAVGDAVLTQVSYAIRKRLRAFDLAYRLGGEEFLILIPGADAAHATEIAELVREGIASQEYEGCAITITLGVSATKVGEAFEYERQFELADRALYEAKRAGRNRVGAGVV
jgi:diguanylate cyclase (GGDEF)-like protein